MNIKKPVLITAAASIVAIGGLTGNALVSAATPAGSNDDRSGLVDDIATKFHLNKGDVQAVFDQHRSERQAERQQKFEDRLDKAVSEGKLTPDQKNQILAKQAELKSYAESIKDKPPKERRQLMKAKLDELKTWAKQNNIPPQYARFVRPGHPGQM